MWFPLLVFSRQDCTLLHALDASQLGIREVIRLYGCGTSAFRFTNSRSSCSTRAVSRSTSIRTDLRYSISLGSLLLVSNLDLAYLTLRLEHPVRSAICFVDNSPVRRRDLTFSALVCNPCTYNNIVARSAATSKNYLQ